MTDLTEPLAPRELVWLQAESPTNLMVVTAAMFFDQSLDIDELRAYLATRLRPFPRFRQRIVAGRWPGRPPRWQTDPHFDIRAHVHHLAAPAPGDRATLEEVIGDLMTIPLNRARPLWQAYLVEGFGPGCALVIRVHHSVGDGVALATLMVALTDPDGRSRTHRPASLPDPRPESYRPVMVMSLPAAATATVRVVRAFWREGLALIREPDHRSRLAERVAGVGEVVLDLVVRSDPVTPLVGDLGVTKRVTWSDPIPLAEIKAAGGKMEATVNDVMVTVLAGAFGRFLSGQGVAIEGLELSIAIPISMRPEEDAMAVNNHTAGILPSVPIGIADPLERLRVVKQRLDFLKRTAQARVTYWGISLVGLTSWRGVALVTGLATSRVSVVASNVRGPGDLRYLAGKPIDRVAAWTLHMPHTALSAAIISYAGQVVLGVSTDAALVPRPQVFLDAFTEEFSLLQRLA